MDKQAANVEPWAVRAMIGRWPELLPEFLRTRQVGDTGDLPPADPGPPPLAGRLTVPNHWDGWETPSAIAVSMAMDSHADHAVQWKGRLTVSEAAPCFDVGEPSMYARLSDDRPRDPQRPRSRWPLGAERWARPRPFPRRVDAFTLTERPGRDN